MKKSHFSLGFTGHVLVAVFTALLFSNIYGQSASLLMTHFFPPPFPAERIIYNSAGGAGASGGGVLPWNLAALAIFAWFYLRIRPVSVFLNEGRDELRENALKCFNSIYRTIALFLLLFCAMEPARFMAANAGDPSFAFRALPYLLVPLAFKTYFSIYFSVLYLEPLLFLKVADRFYDEETLYEKKKGLALSIKAKLYLMIVNLLIIPMAMILGFACLLPGDLGSAFEPALKPGAAAGSAQAGAFVAMCKYRIAFIAIVSLAYAVGYVEMLYKSINRPIDVLIKKMEGLASGDLDVRTTVLSDDEIGKLKHHFNVMVGGLRERERLRETFGKFVSIEIARHLMESGKIDLGGEDIQATVLFSDIRNFTSMSEKMPAREVVDFLNEYFSFVTEPIMKNRGVINKFIGDAVMALYIPHLGSADHATDALKSALGMREKLRQFNEAKKMPAEVSFGIGIHTGTLVAGNIGTKERLEYTVIGDTVNVASRIESENKTFKTDILVSEETYVRIDESVKSGVKFEKCGPVTVKGKQEPLALYKVI